MCTKSNFLLLSQFCYSEDFFVRLKKQNAMPGWCSIIFVLVLFKETNKKKSLKNPSKKFNNEKGQKLLLVLTDFISYSYAIKASFLSKTVVIFHLLQMNSLKITTQ